MNSTYFTKTTAFFCLSALLLVFSNCNNTKTTTKATASPKETTSTVSDGEKLIGSWVYYQVVYYKKVAKKAEFQVTITDKTITLEGNDVECNSCFSDYKVEGNKIIFLKEQAAPICTEMECFKQATFGAAEKGLTYLFGDMDFELLGNELTLKRGGKSLVLSRQE